MEQAATHFGDIGPFLEELKNVDIAPKISYHLRQLLACELDRKALIMELAAVVDASKPFVKATYNLKGDGLRGFSTYTTLQAVATAAAQHHYPNVVAQSLSLGATPAEVAELRALAREGVQPGINYFLKKFNNDFYNVVRVFQAARMACPSAVQDLRPSPEDVEQLCRLPFLDDDVTIRALQKELSNYLPEADGVKIVHGEQMQLWKEHHVQLRHWSSAAKRLALVQPSSAVAERVFSLLSALFDDQQTAALEDYLEAAVMLAYNYRDKD